MKSVLSFVLIMLSTQVAMAKKTSPPVLITPVSFKVICVKKDAYTASELINKDLKSLSNSATILTVSAPSVSQSHYALHAIVCVSISYQDKQP